MNKEIKEALEEIYKHSLNNKPGQSRTMHLIAIERLTKQTLAALQSREAVDLEAIGDCLRLIDNVLGRCYKEKIAVPYGRLQQYIKSAQNHLSGGQE